MSSGTYGRRGTIGIYSEDHGSASLQIERRPAAAQDVGLFCLFYFSVNIEPITLSLQEISLAPACLRPKIGVKLVDKFYYSYHQKNQYSYGLAPSDTP